MINLSSTTWRVETFAAAAKVGEASKANVDSVFEQSKSSSCSNMSPGDTRALNLSFKLLFCLFDIFTSTILTVCVCERERERERERE